MIGHGGERSPGGKGANQALAAALQGADVAFVGAVGSDADGQVALQSLREAGVDLVGTVVTPEHPTGLAIISLSEDGENTIVVLPGANQVVSAASATTVVAGMGLADILLVQGELAPLTTEGALRAAAARGLRVIFNVAPWAPFDRDVLAIADPLVLNEHEAALAARSLGLAEHLEGEQLARELSAGGLRSVVVTLGPAGAVVAQAGQAQAVPSPRVRAVDTTGAGDAFTGALAARLLLGDDLVRAATHAARVGAYAVQHPGAQPSYPDLHTALP